MLTPLSPAWEFCSKEAAATPSSASWGCLQAGEKPEKPQHTQEVKSKFYFSTERRSCTKVFLPPGHLGPGRIFFFPVLFYFSFFFFSFSIDSKEQNKNFDTFAKSVLKPARSQAAENRAC